jgi:hypothetical protein
MKDDPIVAAVREIKEQLAAAFHYDVHAIFSDMRKRESQFGGRLVIQPAPKSAEQHVPAERSTVR